MGSSHRLKFPGRTGQKEEMRQEEFLPFHRRQIEPRRGAVVIRKHLGPFRNHRLPAHPLLKGKAPLPASLMNALQGFRMRDQPAPCDFGRHLPGDVIRSRPQSSADNHEIRPSKGLQERFTDGLPVRHRCLPSNPEAQGKNLSCQPAKVGIPNRSKQEFASRVDDFNSHVRKPWGGSLRPTMRKR